MYTFFKSDVWFTYKYQRGETRERKLDLKKKQSV